MTEDLWEALRAQRRARLDREEPLRMEQLGWLLERESVELVRRLGTHGYRIRSGETEVDFWPRTLKFRTKDGRRTGSGWRPLLRLLKVPPASWDAHRRRP